MEPGITWYDILNVPPDASSEEIGQAYRSKAGLLRPERIFGRAIEGGHRRRPAGESSTRRGACWPIRRFDPAPDHLAFRSLDRCNEPDLVDVRSRCCHWPDT
jgi:hypothetical protein